MSGSRATIVETMELPEVIANCSTCRLRPREEGGSGTCPQTGALLRMFQRQGEERGRNECWKYDPRPFESKAAKKQRLNHPQEAALF